LNLLNDFIEQQLEDQGGTVEEFRELVVRLVNYGILSRDESLVEQQLYDRYVRTDVLVKEYLELLGLRIFHDTRFHYLRVYPPASRVPGMEDAEEQSFSGSFRKRLSQHEVALLLVLRMQYDKALREGNIDEAGCAAESLESLSIAMLNLLGRSLPDKITDRRRLFLRLRQLRIIVYKAEENFESSEIWIKIHPMIVDFVSDESMQRLEDNPTEIELDNNKEDSQSGDVDVS
jgi:hypothetical protein